MFCFVLYICMLHLHNNETSKQVVLGNKYPYAIRDISLSVELMLSLLTSLIDSCLLSGNC